jgi:hypothetical protein
MMTSLLATLGGGVTIPQVGVGVLQIVPDQVHVAAPPCP